MLALHSLRGRKDRKERRRRKEKNTHTHTHHTHRRKEGEEHARTIHRGRMERKGMERE